MFVFSRVGDFLVEFGSRVCMITFQVKELLVLPDAITRNCVFTS